MICGLRFYTRNRPAAALLKKMMLLRVDASAETGDVKFFYAEDSFWKIKFFENDGIRFDGSLHKYFHGANDGLFTYEEVCHAIEKLRKEYGINPNDCLIQRLEIGVNLTTDEPRQLINAALCFREKVGIFELNHGLAYKHFLFKSHTTSDIQRVYYDVKLYQKGPSLLRFEVHAQDLRVFKKHGGPAIKTLADLTNREAFIRGIYFLYKEVDNFTFVPSDNGMLPSSILSDYRLYLADNYWKDLNKSQRYRSKKKIQGIIQEYNLKNFGELLKNGVLEEGAKILSVSTTELMATFSQLGLLGEEVAFCDLLIQNEAVDESDRLVTNEKAWNTTKTFIEINNTILVGGHALVRNRGRLQNATICQKYHALRIRSPCHGRSADYVNMYIMLPC